MPDNIIDFEQHREARDVRRKEARVDAIKRAFRLARGEADKDKPGGKPRRRRKSRKK